MVTEQRPIRAFFAIDLPESAKKTIADIIAELQKNTNNNTVHWTKPHHLHITLQFLEKINSRDISQLIKNVRTEFLEFPPFYLELGQLELFPTPSRPRIISMSMAPQETLANLAKCIGRGIIATDYLLETRPFRGHLTLGRLNQVGKHFSMENVFLATSEKIFVTEIMLYRSDPTSAGPNYTLLEHLNLNFPRLPNF